MNNKLSKKKKIIKQLRKRIKRSQKKNNKYSIFVGNTDD